MDAQSRTKWLCDIERRAPAVGAGGEDETDFPTPDDRLGDISARKTKQAKPFVYLWPGGKVWKHQSGVVMRSTTAILIGVLLVLTAGDAHGQDTVVIEYGKCDIMKVNALRQQADSLWLPVAQQLVAEGKFMYVQVLEAEMADEWNIVWYYRAKDYDTFWSAYQEWGTRVSAMHPDAGQAYNQHCPEWRRFSYKSTVHTEAP